jgi:hypothetical protein
MRGIEREIEGNSLFIGYLHTIWWYLEVLQCNTWYWVVRTGIPVELHWNSTNIEVNSYYQVITVLLHWYNVDIT